mmetsp:Transcript_116399/g.228380  ORF Transcript_116399/g.228380 Transcript_116399/m.228380 type:complete len:90 (+) Transcript_116399:49-318(+)
MLGFVGRALRPIVFAPRASGPTIAQNVFPSQINSFFGLQNLQCVRMLNRNARRPKKANHGKRPVSHARRWEKRKMLTTSSMKEKIFGFW